MEKGDGNIYPVGIIHGRFQVFHNDHLKYLLAGKALCDHLVVGITNADPLHEKSEEENPERTQQESNPLTYYERMILIRSVMNEEGVSPEDFSVVPFPVNMPELYRYYVPMDGTFFLTIYDEWGRKKLQFFQSMRLAVHLLWEKPLSEKGICAADVRQKIIRGEPWEHLVPGPVARHIRSWGIDTLLLKR